MRPNDLITPLDIGQIEKRQIKAMLKANKLLLFATTCIKIPSAGD